MATLVVTFNGTRLNDSDNNTGWGNFVVGGGAPASEPANAYQVTSGTTTGAVGKKITSTSARQGVDYNGSSVDYSGNDYLWFCKVYVADGFNVNATWGVEVAMGSADTSNSHRYNVAGSGANNDAYLTYPAQGGYIITAIDPTIDGWAETADQGGAFDQTGVVWYAIGAQFISGNAKSENVAMDAIDYGTGLTITNGDGASTEGNFIDFVIFDQDDKTARYGVVTGSGSSVIARGILTIGTATITEFLDETSIVTFADGYHSAGLCGVAVGMSNASSIIRIDCTIIGAGKNYVSITDTRPDFIVTGTSGTFNSAANLRNHRDITYTSICEVENADIECVTLVQGGAHIFNSIIRTAGIAADDQTLNDATFASSGSDLHDVEFIQSGIGHAIGYTTTNFSVTYYNITFTGYNAANGQTDSAIFFRAVTGTITITIIGGNVPSYKTAGATIVIINNPVSIVITCKDTLGVGIENARVYLTAASSGQEYEFESPVTSITRSGSTATATLSGGSHKYSVNDYIEITGANQNEYNGARLVTAVTTTTVDYTVTGTPTTPATGTILHTRVFTNQLTTATGKISQQIVSTENNDFIGWARRSTTSPLYRTSIISGSLGNGVGTISTITMILDE